jgi:predicted dehydrogenase
MSLRNCFNQPILVAGAGDMAAEHVKVLLHLGFQPRNIQVVGRGETSTRAFADKFCVPARHGGLAALVDAPLCRAAVVTVSHDQLYPVTMALLEKGCPSILVEKPGALYRKDLAAMHQAAQQRGAQVFIAFNRRFYPSVQAVREFIQRDGRVVSCSFDFTEVERRVMEEKDRKHIPDEVLHRWGIVNSQHVIDLFLHLAGMPVERTCRRDGTLPWHPAGAIFCGCGVTDRRVLFSYLATWSGAGRWGVEVSTPQHRLVLRPLEDLHVQRRGSFQLDAWPLPAEPEGLKPGFTGQMAVFLDAAFGFAADPRLCSLPEALEHFDVAEAILGYDQAVRPA